MRVLATFALAVTLCLAWSVRGAAQEGVNVPPGNSEVDQYFEAVPGAGGNVGVQRPAKTDAAQDVAAPIRRRLEHYGADGRRVAELAAASGPPQSPRTSGGHAGERGTRTNQDGAAGAAGQTTRLATDGESLFGTIADAVVTPRSGGLGPLLPMVLIGALVVPVAMALRRRAR